MSNINNTPPPLFILFKGLNSGLLYRYQQLCGLVRKYYDKPVKRLFWGLLLGLLGISFYFCLPEPLFKPDYSSILLSEKGKLLGAHISHDQQWRFPPIKQLPDKFKTSLILFEDKRFYQHIGVDPLAIARAMKLNWQAGRIVSGGSTLSMQVIRMAAGNPKRTYTEKVIEVIKALRLETRYSKEQILNLYASHAPFGGNVVGLEAASWRYFGRTPAQLSWAESALLAVLPNSPGLVHPGRHRQRLKQKRDRLLKTLFTQGKLSQLDLQLAVAEPLPAKPKPLPRLASHLLDTLVPTSTNQTKRFTTTLDAALQTRINQLARNHAQQLLLKDIHNLAILVIDNYTFKVKAYIGNTPLSGQNHGEDIDLVRRARSTGSTLKPFLFARMIDAGEILPETLVADAPIRYSGYRPRNYDRQFRGAVRAKQALASSLNIPAVNMLSQHGVARFLASLRQMGMSTLYRKSRDYGLALILGGAEGTLWDLTSMYANLANRAQQRQQQLAVNYFQPTVLTRQSSQTRRPNEISPAAAWMTLQALLEVGRPGTEAYWKRFDSSHKVAWKTGTSFGHRDSWAIGTTPQYTVGVWVGNASGEGRQGMTGLKIAAPILFDVFNRLPLTNDWFEKPIRQMKQVSICKDDGFLANDSCATRQYEIPAASHFDRITPYHLTLHIDKVTGERVHSQCEQVSQMQTLNQFVLPPHLAYNYQQFHADYQPLPKWRQDCLKQIGGHLSKRSTNQAISLIYPHRNTQIYLPKELAGKQGKAIFQAMHQDPQARIFWHLDNTFLGTTEVFHEQAIQVSAGKHSVTLVDERGNRIEQFFTVLNE